MHSLLLLTFTLLLSFVLASDTTDEIEMCCSHGQDIVQTSPYGCKNAVMRVANLVQLKVIPAEVCGRSAEICCERRILFNQCGTGHGTADAGGQKCPSSSGTRREIIEQECCISCSLGKELSKKFDCKPPADIGEKTKNIFRQCCKKGESQDKGISKDLGSCCDHGKKLANTEGMCHNTVKAFAKLSPKKIDEKTCTGTSQICCFQAIRANSCDRGKEQNIKDDGCIVSLDQLDLSGPADADIPKKERTPDELQESECCSCCQMARVLKRKGLECTPPSGVDEHCKKAFTDCCKLDKKDEL